ncbi:MAG TPA: CocE/NonD family hydrolase [bacterium]|nr:CocE/NonD family hydrolase [bacterium]
MSDSTEQPWRIDRTGGMVIEWDAGIRMDDGIVLRADIFRPDGEGRHPILLTYGPYAKGLPFQQGYPDQWNRMAEQHPDVSRGSSCRYQSWETPDPEKWVPDGYVCVRVDSRGAGRSPGFLDPFCPRETRDLYECIEWAGARPWSNGRVGLAGISYYAINQWHVAALQPPHLAAICPWEGAADWYRDMTRHGGIVCDFWGNWMKKQVVTVQHGVGDRGPVNPNTGQPVAGPETLSDETLAANRADLRGAVLARPLDGPYYRERSPDWSRVRVPLLSAANWGGQGLHPRGNFEGFMRAASTEKWLEVHGLEHWTHFYTDYGRTLQRRFFDHYLKGVSNGWEDQPRVLLQIRHPDRFEERAEDAWPLPRTQWRRWYLDAGRPWAHGVSQSAPGNHEINAGTLSTEPVSAAANAVYEAAGSGATFTTPPLADATEFTGPAAAKIFLSSSTSDTDVFAVLRAFDPAGREIDFQGALDPHTPIANGWLRASHRRLDPGLSTPWRPYHTHDHAEPLLPGRVYELDIELWPTSIVVPAGGRLSITILGRDFERPGPAQEIRSFVTPFRGSGPFVHADPDDRPASVFGGRNTLHTGGAHGSFVLLPVIPR